MSLRGENFKKLPYLTSVKRYVKQKRTPFHMPGHKQGKGINKALLRLFGSSVFQYDLTEVDGLDYLNFPTGIIKKAEQLAAYAFRSKRTFFLINGSTVGNLASVLSLVNENEKILLPRNSHQSTYAGVILSGAIPIFANATLHNKSGLFPTVSKDVISNLITNHKDIKVIHITSPTHIGFLSNVQEIVKESHKNKIPVIVDEAHGAHFQFHPELPKSALEFNADIVIQSTHKTLGSFTQTSMLHIGNNKLIDANKISSVLRLLQSSSPSTLFIMGLDAARQQMSTNGYSLLTKTLKLARCAREEINKIPGFYCYGKEVIGTDDVYDIDETKLLIDVSKTGYTGTMLEKLLGRKYKVEIEMSDYKNILCFVTIGDSMATIRRFTDALKAISKINKKRIKNNLSYTSKIQIPLLSLSPKSAFFAKKKKVSLTNSIGEISGEFLIPFPPDIPILVPGEKITSEIVDYVQYLRNEKVFIIGPKDKLINSIQVIKSLN